MSFLSWHTYVSVKSHVFCKYLDGASSTCDIVWMWNWILSKLCLMIYQRIFLKYYNVITIYLLYSYFVSKSIKYESSECQTFQEGFAFILIPNCDNF